MKKVTLLNPSDSNSYISHHDVNNHSFGAATSILATGGPFTINVGNLSGNFTVNGHAKLNGTFGTQISPCNLLGIKEYISNQGTLNLSTINDIPDSISVSQGAVYLADQCTNTDKDISIYIDNAALFALQQGSNFHLGSITMMQNGILDFYYSGKPYSFTSLKDDLTFNIPNMIKYVSTDLKKKILFDQNQIVENSQDDISPELLDIFNKIKDFHLIKQLVAEHTSVLDEYFFEIIGTYKLGDRGSCFADKDVATCIASYLSFQDINHLQEQEVDVVGSNNTVEAVDNCLSFLDNYQL